MRRPAAKVVRYATASAICTLLSLCILAVLVGSGATSAGWANVIATAVGTIPSFELNRRWVWGRSGHRSVGAEVGPFWALSFTGLGLSTLAVRSATAWAAGAGLDRLERAALAVGANVATFGTLWVLQYVLLDRVLFAARRAPGNPPTGSSAEPPDGLDREGLKVA